MMTIKLLLILIVSFLLVFSKFLDCLTTTIKMRRANNNINYERNPIARCFMRKFGIYKTIWGIFIFTIFIAFIIGIYIYVESNIVIYFIFIILELIISIIHFSISFTNHTGRFNFITSILNKIYNKFNN